MDSFLQWQIDHWNENNLFPPELEHTKAINMLVDYLLGEDLRKRKRKPLPLLRFQKSKTRA